MNKFLTKQIIYANRIAKYIDFANIDCCRNMSLYVVFQIRKFSEICRIILTSESKYLYFYKHVSMFFIVKK